jgi:hypothetical protein
VEGSVECRVKPHCVFSGLSRFESLLSFAADLSGGNAASAVVRACGAKVGVLLRTGHSQSA